MRKKYMMLSVLMIIMMGTLSIIALFTNSYAVDSIIELPTDSFISNKENDDYINLVGDALKEDETYNDFIDNFKVQRNYATFDNSLSLYSLMKNLTYPTTKEIFRLTDNNPQEINDKGLIYIINHGYNKVNTTNSIFTSNKYGEVEDASTREYITQIAIWLYLLENESTNLDYCIETKIDDEVNACNFYNTSSNTLMTVEGVKGMIAQAATKKEYKYLNYINDLVKDANNYKYSNTTMNPISNAAVGYNYYEDHIVTNLITPTPDKQSINNYLDYSIEISDPENYGVYITNKDGVKITKMNSITEGFKIYIPLKEDITTMDLTRVRISIKGTFLDDTKVYSYTVENDKDNNYAKQIIGYTSLKEEYIGFNLKNFTRISNNINGREIPGGTLVINNKTTKQQVAKWVNKKEPHNLILNEGSYELCQEAVDDKYVLNTKCVEFNIEKDKINSEIIENKLSNNLANAIATSDLSAYLIALFLFSLSGGIIFYSFKVNKISAQ